MHEVKSEFHCINLHETQNYIALRTNTPNSPKQTCTKSLTPVTNVRTTVTEPISAKIVLPVQHLCTVSAHNFINIQQRIESPTPGEDWGFRRTDGRTSTAHKKLNCYFKKRKSKRIYSHLIKRHFLIIVKTDMLPDEVK
jgi:hypothetical protein